MAGIEEKAVEIMDKLDKLATQYAPDVMESALAAVQVSAVGNLVMSVAAILFVVVVGYVCLKYWRHSHTDESSYESETICEAITVVYIVLGFIVLAVCIIQISDVWNYVAIFNPKLALAHKILGL